MPVIQELFDSCYALGDHEKQTAYIQDLVKSKQVKRQHADSDESVPVCTQTREYSVTYNSLVHKVCKAGFLAIFFIGDKQMHNALQKVTKTRTPLSDSRGKHPAR